MFDTAAIKRSFGRAASAYDAKAHLQRQVRQHCIVLAKAHWAQEAHILDAGCGTGALVEDIRRGGIGWQVTGVDLSPGMCGEAQKKNGVVNADAQAMPFANKSFDGIFSSLMLQWANHPLAVLQEMRRVMIPGGRCVIATLAQGTLHELSEAFAMLDASPHVSAFLPQPEILRFAAEAGLTLVLGQEHTIIESYPDVATLMRSLKAIGAGNKETGRRRGMMTPQQLEKLEQAYRWRFGGMQGLPATWQVVYLILEKP